MGRTRVAGRFTRCRFGVARRDVTPPVGIYHRSWGAAVHDTAEGVHRPMLATVAVFAPADGAAGETLALVALDLGWFGDWRDEAAFRRIILDRTGLPPAALLVNLSHTHAGAAASPTAHDVPGGHLIPPFFDMASAAVTEAVDEARAQAQPAWVSWGAGRCDLAQQRDYWDAAAGRWACGYNPDPPAPPDDTLLVGRVTADSGETLATIVNYACHPTTLAWDNRLISPDFVGATREVLEAAFGAPALFLQGASGELEPAECYVGDAAVADRHGRRLGHAAAAAIEGLAPPASAFAYTGIVESGAVLGTWAWQPGSADELAGAGVLTAGVEDIDLARKPIETPAELLAALAGATEPYRRERLTRRLRIAESLGTDPVFPLPLWSWRLGQAAVIAVAGEPYSAFQTTLRAKHADHPVLVLGVTNGGVGYLCPADLDGTGLYQELQSPFAAGCFERTLAVAERRVGELMV